MASLCHNELIQGHFYPKYSQYAHLHSSMSSKSDINMLMRDCSISSALAMAILQSCTKPSICSTCVSAVQCVCCVLLLDCVIIRENSSWANFVDKEQFFCILIFPSKIEKTIDRKDKTPHLPLIDGHFQNMVSSLAECPSPEWSLHNET